MPLHPIHVCVLSCALLLAAPAAAFMPKGGTTPDIATSVSAPPFPSAGTVLAVDATFQNTPTADTEAVFSVEVSEAWSFHSSDCDFAAQGPGHAQMIADIAQNETLECTVRFQIPPTYTGSVTIDAEAVSFEDPNTGNNADQVEIRVVRLRVNTTSDGFDNAPGDGICRHADGLPVCSLRAAVIEANALPGDQRIEIPYNASSYVLTREGVDTEYFGDLDLTSSIWLDGIPSAQGELPVVHAAFSSSIERVLDVALGEGQRVQVENLALVGVGLPVSGHGGVMRHIGGSVRLDNVDISGGAASHRGGGLYSNGTATLIEVRVHENSAAEGAGAAVVLPVDGQLVVIRAAFTDNLGSGAISNGGGLYLTHGQALISAALFANNHADEGGALFVLDSDVFLSNSTLSDNIAASNGGGIFATFATLYLEHCTVADNAAAPGDDNDGFGGGIYVASSASAQVEGSIFVGNSAQVRVVENGDFTLSFPHSSACFGTVGSIGYNAVQSVSLDQLCSWQAAEGDDLNTIAAILPLADNGGFSATRALAPTAAQIDTAGPSCPSTDQRQVLRPQDGDLDGEARCDKGAYEYVAPAVISVVKQGNGEGTIVSDPPGIHCGATCDVDFEPGTTVTLLPSQASGSTFLGWSGPCSGTGHCVVTAQPGVTEVTGTWQLDGQPNGVFADGFE